MRLSAQVLFCFNVTRTLGMRVRSDLGRESLTRQFSDMQLQFAFVDKVTIYILVLECLPAALSCKFANVCILCQFSL